VRRVFRRREILKVAGASAMKKREKTLTSKMLSKKIDRSIAHLSKLSFLENYAMFMGKSQLIEFSLKKILSKRYRYGKKKLEKMTLGVAIAELERLGMRKDLVSLLKELNRFRIAMAHKFLVDHAYFVALDRKFGRLSMRPLQDALAKVEETIHVYDFLNQNRWLLKGQRKGY
jgi:hypothetical protein